MRDPNPVFGRRQGRESTALARPVMAARQPGSSVVNIAAISLAAIAGLAILLGVAVQHLSDGLRPRAVTAPATQPVAEEGDSGPPDLTPLRAFPNTTVTYYDVPGTDTRAISDYMHTHGAVDGHDHSVGEGWTSWRMKWRWPVTAAGCDTAAVQVTFSAEVTLPRFVDMARMDAEHQAGWNRYLNALITHESGHIRYPYQHVGDVAAAVRGLGCTEADAAARKQSDLIGQHDAAYDIETHHGQLQGLRYPD